MHQIYFFIILLPPYMFVLQETTTYQVLPLMISFVINIGTKWWHKLAAITPLMMGQ
jgi:hypothetical protein